MTAGIVVSRRTKLGATAPTAFVPPQLASVRSDFRPSGLAAFANNDPVGSWVDAGPGNLPATETMAGRKPLAKTGVLNGLTVVEFDGVDDVLATGPYAVAAAQPVTRFLVARFLTTTGNQYLLDGYLLNDMVLTNGSGTTYLMYAGAILTGPAIDTGWHIFCETFNGASSRLRVDGGAGVGGNAGSSGLPGLTLGASANETINANCQIAYASATGALLTLSEINQWGSYLAAETGLPWTTPT